MKNRYFPIVLYAEASPEVQAIYDETMKLYKTNFVLNYFKAQGSNLTSLGRAWLHT